MKNNPKLLIVDDEVVTRRGLIKNVPWEALGIQEIREAENGRQALDMLDDYQPDLLLTDIRMPVMNGIELASLVSQRLPGCKIIFLSGFSDKEYLKAAIQIGVVDYVEKPIDVEELSSTVRKAVDLYWEEVKRPMDNIDETMIRKGLVDRIIRHQVDENKMQPVIENLGLVMGQDTLAAVVVVQISRQQKELNASEVMNLIDSHMDDYFDHRRRLCSVKDSQHLIWIVMPGEARDFDKIDEVRRQIAMRYPGLNSQLFYSVSSSVRGLHMIYKAYQSCVINLQRLFLSGYGSIIHEGTSDTIIADEVDAGNISYAIDALQQMISEKKYKEIPDRSEQWMRSLRFQQGLMVNDIKNTIFQMILLLHNHAQSEISYDYRNESDEPYLWELIFNMETLDELKRLFDDICNKVIKAVDSSNTYSKATRKAIQLIRDTYMNPDLSTKILADQVFLTTSYLSGLFKKETGTNISKFIRDVRIEASKELLKDESLQLWEVAEQVGYTDSNYYAKTFKKETGISPSEFRERQLS